MNKNVVHVIGIILISFGIALLTNAVLNYFQTSDNPVQKSSDELREARYHNYELAYLNGYIDGANNVLDSYDPKKDGKLIKSDFRNKRIEDSIKFRNKIRTNEL